MLEQHVDDDGERLIEVNQRRAASIDELIQNVRALMKSVSGETSLAPIGLRPVLEQEIEALGASHPEVTVEVGVPDGLVVRADELIGAVFENLLDNAVEHNDADEPHVTVTAEPDGDVVTVAVADDGPGMSSDERDRYFESGERGEGSEGLGLGLYLVRTLVDRYDGAVAIEDNEPRGTVISVELERSG